MSEQPGAKRNGRWIIAVVLVGAGLFFVLDMIERPRSASPVRADPSTAASQPVGSNAAPVTTVATLASSAPAVSTAKKELWPEPTVSLAFAATSSSTFGDPFEGDGGRPGDVRELVRVGRTRLGVTIESKVKDEKAVIAVLTELGTEIDEKEKGRTDDFERRIMEYQPIFQKYRSKLAPHMEGAFAVKGGDGWTDTERIVHPHADAAPH